MQMTDLFFLLLFAPAFVGWMHFHRPRAMSTHTEQRSIDTNLTVNMIAVLSFLNSGLLIWILVRLGNF